MKHNLIIKRKTKGRSYKFVGQDLTNSVWYLVDEDGNTYNDYEAYLEAHKKEVETEVKVEEVKLTPQQKAAITRAANKAAKEEE